MNSLGADPRAAFANESLIDLGDYRIAVLGCGSVGGLIAWCCSSAGIRMITLADRDALEAANLRRHVGGRGDLGRNKVEISADFLRQRFSHLDIATHGFDVLDDPERLRMLIHYCDLAFVAVDAEGPKHLIDAMTRELAKPAVYAGIYGGGWAGEVILTDPAANSPCYACCARTLGRVGVPVEIDFPADYALPSPELPESAWSRADLTSIVPVAALATRIGIARLAKLTRPALRDEFGPGFAWRLPLRGVPAWATCPWELRSIIVERDPDCFNCARPAHNPVTLSAILKEAA